MSGAGLFVLLLAAVPAPRPAEVPRPAELTAEHRHPSEAFSFRTPADWTVGPAAGDPSLLEARGDGAIVRFRYRLEESGFDSLHVTCMLERLAPEQDTNPHVRYEHDFLSGSVGEYRVLDSAFVVEYDAEVAGERRYRQRNVTIVGPGGSLCASSHVAVAALKKKKTLGPLLDAVLASVSFK